MMRLTFIQIIFLSVLGLFSGCKKDEIHTYRLAKHEPSVGFSAVQTSLPPPSMESGAAAHWKTPEGWVTQPLSPMRVGSFLAKAKNGYEADISVVALAGDAGGTLANVNRWRDQIGLSPISDDELSRHLERLTIRHQTMLVVDLKSTENIVDQKSKKRVVAVICNRPSKTWFIKMTGEENAVGELKPTLREFLASMTFED